MNFDKNVLLYIPDEENCSHVKALDDYDKRKAPSKRVKKRGQVEFQCIQVRVNVEILFLMEINEAESSWSVLFSYQAMWYDLRLQYNFLKERPYQNKIIENKSSIWSPSISYGVTLNLESLESQIMVKKQQEPEIEDGLFGIHPKGKRFSF